MNRAVSDPPAVLAVITFAPPAVWNAQIQHSVDRRLDPACARRLHRPDGVVQPHVHALDQPAGDVHVVVLDEENMTPQRRILDNAEYVTDQVLALPVARMRLARKNYAHRPVLRRADGTQSLYIVEDHPGPLVPRKTPRKSDPQRLAVDQLLPQPQLVRAVAVTGKHRQQPALHERHQPHPLRLVHFPDLLVRQRLDLPRPLFRIPPVVRPFLPEMPLVHLPDIGAQPAQDVDAVRDRVHPGIVRAGGGRGPERSPVGFRDIGVQAAYAVEYRRCPDRQRRQTEGLAVRLVGKGAPEFVKFIRRQAQPGFRGRKVFFD